MRTELLGYRAKPLRDVDTGKTDWYAVHCLRCHKTLEIPSAVFANPVDTRRIIWYHEAKECVPPAGIQLGLSNEDGSSTP